MLLALAGGDIKDLHDDSETDQAPPNVSLPRACHFCVWRGRKDNSQCIDGMDISFFADGILQLHDSVGTAGKDNGMDNSQSSDQILFSLRNSYFGSSTALAGGRASEPRKAHRRRPPGRDMMHVRNLIGWVRLGWLELH